MAEVGPALTLHKENPGQRRELHVYQTKYIRLDSDQRSTVWAHNL